MEAELDLRGLCCVCSVKDSFRVKIWSLEKEYVRVHVPAPLDRGDGSLLVRYRLYGSASKGLSIEVMYQDKPVANSPYNLTGKGFFSYLFICFLTVIHMVCNQCWVYLRN